MNLGPFYIVIKWFDLILAIVYDPFENDSLVFKDMVFK
jgi:hypothetical protein